MSHLLDIGSEPNLQRIIIVSAILHVLFFIVIFSFPFNSTVIENKSYLINLVPASESELLTENSVAREDFRKINIAKLTPRKATVKEGLLSRKDRTGKTASLKTAARNQTASRFKLRGMFENTPAFLKKELPVVRTKDRQKRDYHHLPMHFDKKSWSEGNERKVDAGLNKIIIAREVSAKQNITEQKYQSVVHYQYLNREINENVSKQGHIIARDLPQSEKTYRRELPYRDQDYRKSLHRADSSGLIPDYHIDRNSASVQEGQQENYLKQESYDHVPVDGKGSVGFDYFTQKENQGSIEKPDRLITSEEKADQYERLGDQIVNSSVPDEKDKGGYYKLATLEIAINGVPLDDLLACQNALDEGMLKKKILNIIGNNTKCYSPSVGKFAFLGTGRFSSFDMTIFPTEGRQLLNRCEELKNAFSCLDTKEE